MGFGFKKEFVLPIQARTKILTFRAIGKRRPPHLGERLYFWYGLRTKQAKKIGEAVCEAVEEVFLHEDRIEWPEKRKHAANIGPFGNGQLDVLAKMDGFESWESLIAFHRKENGGLPARRLMICWGKTFEEVAA